MKKTPTGFIAICQCGKIIGAADCVRSDRKELGQLLGKWLFSGCTVEPMFLGTWEVSIKPCECETYNAKINGAQP